MHPGVAGIMTFYAQASSIFGYDEGTTFGRAQYFAIDGFSGCAAITEVVDGEVKVVGLHSGALDNRKDVPAITFVKLEGMKSSNADAQSQVSSISSQSRNFHGRSVCCFICIVNKIPELMEEITNDKLITNNDDDGYCDKK